MKRFIFLLFSLVLFFSLPKGVWAHAGGGPPFVMINGQYAQTSPLFLGAPTEKGLNVPQDEAPTPFLINQEITFSVDTKQLTLDPAIIQNLTFEWSFNKGSNFTDIAGKTQTGETTKKKFSAPGSYLVTLKSNPGGEFIVLDTILINILPKSSYRIPSASVEVSSAKKSGLVSQFSADSTSSNPTYYWDFNDNKIETGKIINKTFKQDYFYTPVIMRMFTDGFVKDTGVVVVGDKGDISFSLLDPRVPRDTLKIQSRKAPIPVILAAILITLLAISGIIVFVKKRKK